MGCIKSKSFLFWKWEVVEHDFEMYSIDKFMDTSPNFRVWTKCKVCGAINKKSFVERDELLLKGFSLKFLESVTTFGKYAPFEDLVTKEAEAGKLLKNESNERR